MRLVYEISANDQQLRRVLRGVEQEAKASSRRVAREQQAAMQGPGRKEATASRRYEEQQARGLARAQASLDRQRHSALMSNYRAEERERLRAEKAVTDTAVRLERTRFRARQQAEQDFARMRERTAARISSGAAKSVGGGIGHAVRIGGELAALAGGFGAASALETQLTVSRKASILANQSEQPGAKGAIAKEALGVRGFTGEESLDFLTNFHEKSGDLAGARGALSDMARLALATGTDFGELGSAAGSAFSVIKSQVKDPQERLRVLSDVMTTVAQQGSMGAIEMRNLVDGMGQLGGASRKFEGGPGQVLKSMGALAQVALQTGGAGSPEEAVTAVARFASDLPEHAKEFEKQGIGIFTDSTRSQLRSPEKILADMMAKTEGDLTKMGALFGVRSQKVAFGFSPAYLDAERENAALPAAQRLKKGEAGRRALLAKYGGFADATRSAAELAEQAASRLNDPDLQLKEATKAVNSAVGDAMVPMAINAAHALRDFTPVLADGTHALARFVAFLTEHPFEGVGAIVGASVAKDIGEELGKAGLEATLKSALTGSLVGGLTLGVGTLVATVALAKLIIDAFQFGAQRDVAAAAKSAGDINEQARSELESKGVLSDETRAALTKLNATQTGALAAGDAYLNSKEGALSWLGRFFSQVTGGKHNISEGMHLGETAASADYRRGATETEALLAADDTGRRFGEAAAKQLLEKLKGAQIVLGARDPRGGPIKTE